MINNFQWHGAGDILWLVPFQVDFRVENAEPLLKNLLGGGAPGGSDRDPAGGTRGRSQSKNREGKRRRESGDGEEGAGNEACSPSISSYLERAKAMVSLHCY